jgi:competence protein CoiA
MEALSLLQSFALNNVGDIVSVEEVERGLACECTCPGCGTPVMAKQGEVRTWHFAHATGTDCPGGAESALHLAAKQLIEKTGGLELPGLAVRSRVQLADGRQGESLHEESPYWIDFDKVQLEVQIENRRPDIVGFLGKRRYLIEVAVTHYVDEPKRFQIQQLNLPAIEIDLGSYAREAWTWAELEAAVIHDVTRKHWIHHPERQAFESLAQQKAIAHAESQALPESSERNPAVRLEKECYRVSGHYIELRKLPFGIALWSPYDPVFNEQIKEWARRLGGKYKAGYRNWVFNSAVKPFLVNAIKAAGGVEM